MPRPPITLEDHNLSIQVLGRIYTGHHCAREYPVRTDATPSRNLGEAIASDARRLAEDFSTVEDCRVIYTRSTWTREWPHGRRVDTKRTETICLRGWRSKASAKAYARAA